MDGAPACPFVAFDDDRDARATAPDHRHRCFAEAVPAPRALAHQDAYCLSPAFAVCPAFQDWARREAAAARPGAVAAAEARPPREETPTPVPLPPLEREPRHAPADAAGSIPPRRPPARDWAAPPPWTANGDAGPDVAGAPGPAPEEAPAPGAVSGWNVAAAGAAGAAAAGAASRSRSRDGDWGDASRGLADSAAARLAGPDPDALVAAQPQRNRPSDPVADLDDVRRDDPVDDREPVAAPVQPVRPAVGPAARAATPPPRKPAATPPTAEAEELFGPAWERPRRYEAYPSLRTRVGLPSFGGLPRLGVAAAALVVAALVLFFVGPMLLGLGGKSPTTGVATATPIASAEPSGSLSPTLAPAPTPFVYTVVKGDTLTRIASKNGVTVKQILAANPQIKNQNAIAVGDKITIPVAAATPVTDGTGASTAP